MWMTHHAVDFAYTRQELDALFRDAHAHDVERGGHDEARSAAINLWRHRWANDATWEGSETIGTFSFDWAPTPRLWQIETDEGFTLEDLIADLGRLELQAPGSGKHGDGPREGRIA
jgi:hypothetical protein